MPMDSFSATCVLCHFAAKPSGWCAHHEAQYGPGAKKEAPRRPRAPSFLTNREEMAQRGARGAKAREAAKAVKAAAPTLPLVPNVAPGEVYPLFPEEVAA